MKIKKSILLAIILSTSCFAISAEPDKIEKKIDSLNKASAVKKETVKDTRKDYQKDTIKDKSTNPLRPKQPFKMTNVKDGKFVSYGAASFYSTQFHGRKTANGERFNMHAMTMAHRTLPFGSKVKVTCMSTGKSVVVKVNDRGPFHGNRIADLSYSAAKSLGIVKMGVAEIKLELLN